MGAAAPEIERVDSWLRGLPSTLCAEFESLDGGAEFREDRWESPAGGGGITRVLENGAVLEKAGVNFSRVTGDSPPPSATAARPTLAGKRYTTMGVSLVVHPANPHVPMTHMNVRFFYAGDDVGASNLELGASSSAEASISHPTTATRRTPCIGTQQRVRRASRSAPRSIHDSRSGATTTSS